MGDFANLIEELSDELSSCKIEKCSKNPKITIIIPAYNVEAYISECLLSVIKQSLKDIEIIVMNDGSTDCTLQIIKTFMQYDARIRLIDEVNRGVGAVKNDALKRARGEYVMFIDSDDVIDTGLLENTYNTIIDNNVDVVVFGAYNLINGKRRKSSYGIDKLTPKYKNKILSNNIVQNILSKIPVLGMCKLYNREFLIKNNIYFQEGCIGEDQIFFIKSMLLLDKLFILDKNSYGYRRKRNNSLTFNKQKKDNSIILNFYAIESFLKNISLSDKLKNELLYTYFSRCISWFGKCEKSFKKEYFKDLENLFDYVAQNYPNFPKVKICEKDTYLILKLKLLILKIKDKINGKCKSFNCNTCL